MCWHELTARKCWHELAARKCWHELAARQCWQELTARKCWHELTARRCWHERHCAQVLAAYCTPVAGNHWTTYIEAPIRPYIEEQIIRKRNRWARAVASEVRCSMAHIMQHGGFSSRRMGVGWAYLLHWELGTNGG